MRAALFNFESTSTSNLQHAAEEIVPVPLRRRFKNEERARAHWAGRAAVAHLLKLNGSSGLIVPNQEYGYLELRDSQGRPSPLFCNISHTEKVAAAVVATAPVGIDVESISRDGSRVLKRVSTDAEKKAVSKYCAGFAFANPAILLWSSKEAFSKALGLGMKFGFQKLEVDLSAGPPFRGKTSLQSPLKVESPVVIPKQIGDYLLTVCVDKKTAMAGGIEWSTLSSLNLTS